MRVLRDLGDGLILRHIAPALEARLLLDILFPRCPPGVWHVA